MKDIETEQLFTRAVTSKINDQQQIPSNEISSKLVDCLQAAAEATLPNARKEETSKEIWRNYDQMNTTIRTESEREKE